MFIFGQLCFAALPYVHFLTSVSCGIEIIGTSCRPALGLQFFSSSSEVLHDVLDELCRSFGWLVRQCGKYTKIEE